MKARVTIADIERAACLRFRISKREIREGSSARRGQIKMSLAREMLHRRPAARFSSRRSPAFAGLLDLLTRIRAPQAHPRQIVMFLAKEMLHRRPAARFSSRRSPAFAGLLDLLTRFRAPQAHPAIGRYFGRDHTTALYAVRRMRALSLTDGRLAQEILSVKELVAKICVRLPI